MTTASRIPRHRRRAELSQNLLNDPRVAEHIVRISEVDEHGFVVEIGGGDGILTWALSRRAGRVISYETDPYFAGRQNRRFADDPRVRCVHRDFLSTSPPDTDFHVVANIPYRITSQIVDWCLAAPRLRTATLLTQLEYARKRTGDYGRWTKLTVETWPRFDWRLAGRVGREKFRPRPRVDSGVLRLSRRNRPLLPVRRLPEYRRFVETGFSGVGGSLRTSLSRRYPARAVDRGLAAAGVDRAAPVGFVSAPQWIIVFEAVARL